jgi:hypothetical protein
MQPPVTPTAGPLQLTREWGGTPLHSLVSEKQLESSQEPSEKRGRMLRRKGPFGRLRASVDSPPLRSPRELAWSLEGPSALGLFNIAAGAIRPRVRNGRTGHRGSLPLSPGPHQPAASPDPAVLTRLPSKRQVNAGRQKRNGVHQETNKSIGCGEARPRS